MRLRIRVNGRLYVVEVNDLTSSPIDVTVNGRPYQVSIETEPSAKEALEVPPRDPEQAQTPSLSVEAQVRQVKAPMPGNILDIAVKVGDVVRVRQQLCSLEAMKMKNAIHSPRDGVIASVEVIEGQAVAHGDVLFTFTD